MTGIADMFAELDGYVRYDERLTQAAHVAREKQRERWRENKRRQRADARRAGKRRDNSAYTRRWQNDPAFREHRRAYWRAYDKARREARAAA